MDKHSTNSPVGPFRRLARLAWIAVLALAPCGTILADTPFSNYVVRSDLTFNFPTSPSLDQRGPTVFDNLADGRLLILSTFIPDPLSFDGVPQLYVETAVGSRTWQSVGTLPVAPGANWSAFGGAFLTVSPDGSRVAVGDNGFGVQNVAVFETSDLLTLGAGSMPLAWYGVPHFDAAWYDNRHLALTYAPGATSSVSVLDTDSPVAAPVNPTIISNVGGASSGIDFDAAGNLYTGNGFDNVAGGSEVGDIKRFDFADWQDSITTGTPLDFEAGGTYFGSTLSAGSLQFDNDGNLFVGGADFFDTGEIDFLALFQNPDLGSGLETFDPNADATSSYVLSYNEATGELYAYEPFALDEPIDHTAVYVIRPIPEPSTIVLLAIGGVLALLLPRARRK